MASWPARTWTALELVTAAMLNGVRDQLNELRAGGIALSSQAANDLQYALTTTTWGRLANGTTGQVLTATTSTPPSWLTPSILLLKVGSGTSTAAGTTTVDSIALSGLSGSGALLIDYVFESDTQQTASVTLTHVTDGGTVSAITNGAAIPAGASVAGHCFVKPAQSAQTKLVAHAETKASAGSAAGALNVLTTATAFTGSWTLGLAHTGVTSGGTFRYRWSVYRLG